MKSFNEHIGKKPEELKEDPLDDLTDLLWVGAAAGGLWAVGKAWDKWGKGSAAASMFAFTDKQKAKVAQDKIDKADAAQKDKESMAGAKALDYDKDEDGKITNQKDAQEYKDTTGKAPEGWVTSPEKSPGKGEVWTIKDQEKWDADAEKRAETKKKRGTRDTEKTKAGQDVTKKKLTDLTPAEKKKRLALAKQKRADREAGKEEFQRFALQELFIDLTENSRTQLLEELVLEETMTITESNELQAIMALDDVGIKAEINRKGQVVIKKKDKKKAHRALEKSFTKGGWPPLKLEDVELTEGLGKLDKSVIDAFYYKKEKAGKIVSTDGDSLNKTGMGGQTIAQWLKPSGKIAISAVTDVKSTESILKYMKKSIPKGNFDKKSYKKFFGEEVQHPRSAYEVVSEARNRIIETIDSHAAVELYNFMQNERDLQRQKDSIIKNIVRKKKSGKYDHSKAPKLWMYWVDNGAKAYDKLYSSPGAKTFDKDTRGSIAIQFANEYNAEIDLGNYN